MTQLETDVRHWIGEGREVEVADCYDNLTIFAKGLLAQFWVEYPEHETEDRTEAETQLTVIASAVGKPSTVSLCTGAKIHGTGAMSIELRAAE